MSEQRIGVIGGSGLAALPELEVTGIVGHDGGFGSPSSRVVLGRLFGAQVAFLARHGADHSVSPARVNARANIDALKRAGCRQLVSFSAVGSLRESIPPGRFVLVDQFIDRTHGRASTFFEEGVAAHVAFGDPVCGRLRELAALAASERGIPHEREGTYVVMNGPQFSTRAESTLHRQWGASVIGMTALPEAKLAREAEVCFLCVAMPTDYDCWHVSEGPVTAAQVSAVMCDLRHKAVELLSALLPKLAERHRDCDLGCHRMLDGAIMTSPESVRARNDPRTRHLLERWLRDHSTAAHAAEPR